MLCKEHRFAACMHIWYSILRQLFGQAAFSAAKYAKLREIGSYSISNNIRKQYLKLSNMYYKDKIVANIFMHKCIQSFWLNRKNTVAILPEIPVIFPEIFNCLYIHPVLAILPEQATAANLPQSNFHGKINIARNCCCNIVATLQQIIGRRLVIHRLVWYFNGVIMLIWAATWDFQQCGMCNQQSLRSACPYAQSDQSLC